MNGEPILSSNSVPILVCRLTWMNFYASTAERGESNHSYVTDGNVAGESLNFLNYQDAGYEGYVQVKGDSIGSPGKVNINRLGARKMESKLDGIIVVFAATHPARGGIRVVGWYSNATVYREPITNPKTGSLMSADVGERTVRITSNAATLIPTEDRHFQLPRGLGGIGQSDLWYGLQSSENVKLKELLLEYIREENLAEQPQLGVTETAYWKQHWQIERRSTYRYLIEDKGYVCDACNWSSNGKDEIWKTSLEIHHLIPKSELKPGDTRKLTADQFAVLCARCHRAIHRSKYVSDIELFRKEYL